MVAKVRTIEILLKGSPVSSTNKTDRRDITENIGEFGVKHHNTNSNP
jgi:hypothetical protein